MKTKLIIIDDEAIIRESLRRFIDWESIGVEVCDVAANGMTAMASILNHTPDIILTDIRMPGLDGLELIRLLKEQNVKSEVIFISAYTNFEYAKKAITLGAFGYITKPLNEEELLNEVRKCKEKIDSERKTQSILSTYQESAQQKKLAALNHLLSGQVSDTEKELLEEEPWMQHTPNYLAAVSIWYPENETPRISPELITELFSGNADYPYVFMEPFQEAQFLFVFSDRTKTDLSSYLSECMQAKFFRRDSVMITCSVPHTWNGNFSQPFIDCSLTYAYHCAAKSGGFYTFQNTFLTHSPVSGPEEFIQKYFEEPLHISEIPTLLRDFLVYFIENNSIYDTEFMKLQFIRLIDRWISKMKIYHLQDYLNKDVLSAQKYITAQTYLHEIFATTYNLFCNLTSVLNEISQNSNSQLVRNCISYIHEHYGENITLSTIADTLYVTPAYLSKVFSSEMQQPFSKYLQEYRISKSIEYMLDPHLKLYNIATLCGFSDVAYFSKSFKAVTGKSPNHYRNEVL